MGHVAASTLRRRARDPEDRTDSIDIAPPHTLSSPDHPVHERPAAFDRPEPPTPGTAYSRIEDAIHAIR